MNKVARIFTPRPLDPSTFSLFHFFRRNGVRRYLKLSLGFTFPLLDSSTPRPLDFSTFSHFHFFRRNGVRRYLKLSLGFTFPLLDPPTPRPLDSSTPRPLDLFIPAPIYIPKQHKTQLPLLNVQSGLLH